MKCVFILSFIMLYYVRFLQIGSHLILRFADNQVVFWDFKIQNSIQITEGLDNRHSDNQGSTVYTYVCTCMLSLIN